MTATKLPTEQRRNEISFGSWTRLRLRGVSAIIAIALIGSALTPASGEDKRIAARRAAEIKTFTDAQIMDGFFKVTFGSEFRTEGPIDHDRIRKFDSPVRIFIDNRGHPDRTAQLHQVIGEIRKRIDRLDIALADSPQAANMIVTLVRDRDLGETITNIYGREGAKKIQSKLEPQCLSGFRRDENYRIVHAKVILVVDAGEFVFYDCAYEEILQALGPINDDNTVPWTMFNDNVQMGFFGVYDQYLLNILYHERMRPGMTRQEARALLHEILPQVRAFVGQTNKLPH